MLRLWLTFVMLIGIASGSRDYTEQMIKQLNETVSRLDFAQADALAKGFNLYKSAFDDFYNKVEKLRHHRGSFFGDDEEFWYLSRMLNSHLTDFLKNPFPIEHLKADAIYLTAILELSKDELSTAKDLFHNVSMIIGLEANTTSAWPEKDKEPTPEVAKLREMYVSMYDFLYYQNFPKFDDHYKLVNWTLDYFKDHGSDAEKVKDLATLENETFSMASKLPITSMAMAEAYKKTSAEHYRQRKTLQADIGYKPSESRIVLDKLAQMEKRFRLPVEKYRKQGLLHYVQLLQETHKEIRTLIKRLKELLADPDYESGRFYRIKNEAEDLEEEILKNHFDPSPIETTVAKALYLAAAKDLYPKPEELYAKVVKFVKYQKYYAGLLPPGRFENDVIHLGVHLNYRTLEDTETYDKLYHEVKTAINGFEPPSQKDFEQVIQLAREKKLFADVVDRFEKETFKMNSLLEFEGKDGHDIKEYFDAATKQHQDYLFLKKGLGIDD